MSEAYLMDRAQASDAIALFAEESDLSTAQVIRKFLDAILLAREFKKLAKYREAKRTARWFLDNFSELDHHASAPLKAAVKVLQEEAVEYDLLPAIDPTPGADKAKSADVAPGPEKYPVGTKVKILGENILRRFAQPTWRYHHPVQRGQMDFADSTSVVRRVEYYYGGDILYYLTDTNGFVWHEDCLSPVR